MVLYEPSKPKKNPYLKLKDIPFLVRILEKYGYKFKEVKEILQR